MATKEQQHQQRQRQQQKNWVFTETGCGQLTACFVSFSSSKCKLFNLACLLSFDLPW